jgi:hypothetical protein
MGDKAAVQIYNGNEYFQHLVASQSQPITGSHRPTPDLRPVGVSMAGF